MTITRYEDWSYEQHLCAYVAMYAHGEEVKSHPLAVHGKGSASLAIQRLLAGEFKAAFVGTGYLVLYDTRPTWCTEEPMFYEVLLRRVLPNCSFEDAVQDIKELARSEGCVAVITGNGRMRPGLRKLYEREGAQIIGETYFMEV